MATKILSEIQSKKNPKAEAFPPKQFEGMDPLVTKYASPDDLAVCITALEDIMQVSDALDATVELYQTGEEIHICVAVDVLIPIAEKLRRVVSMDLPGAGDLDLIHKRWNDEGRPIKG
jgi:hypothetical protein